MHYEIEEPQLDAPDDEANPKHGITLLTGIYLEAGLPLYLAVQSAVADCEMFDEALLCA
jgi:hypothetical protein